MQKLVDYLVFLTLITVPSFCTSRQTQTGDKYRGVESSPENEGFLDSWLQGHRGMLKGNTRIAPDSIDELVARIRETIDLVLTELMDSIYVTLTEESEGL